MKIGVDIRALQNDHRYRGIGVYLRHLLQALGQIDDQNEYVMFANPGSNPLSEIELGKLNFKVITLRKPAKSVIADKLWNWLNPAINLNDHKVDVFLQPDIALGLAGGSASKVCVGYDMIELIYKEHYYPPVSELVSRGPKKLLGSLLRQWIYMHGLRNYKKADRILAISEATKRDMVRLLGLSADKIATTPLAYDEHYKPAVDKAILEKYSINSPYILYTGGADFRKNVSALLKAFDEVKKRQSDLTLVLVGKDFENQDVVEHQAMWRLINDPAIRESIVLVGYASDDQLCGLFSSAQVFVFPSLYEGFGMPPLEAMACGCPVIAYNNSSIPEVVGKAAMIVSNPSEIADAIIEITGNKTKRDELINAGLEQAKKFSWHNTAKQTLDVLEEVAI